MEYSDIRREFIRATREMQVFAHESVGPLCHRHGLTPQQLYVLMELNLTPGQTMAQLGERVGILRANFTLVCRKLEDQGLIARERSAEDRRAFRLHLTEAGRNLLEQLDRDATAQYGAVFENEPPETFEAIAAGLDAMRSLIRKIGKGTAPHPSKELPCSDR